MKNACPRSWQKNAEMTCFYSLIGGLKVLVKAMSIAIEAGGGVIHTNCAINSIVVKDGRACGLLDSKGILHECDLVIASGGARETFIDLVGKDLLPEGYAEKVTSISLMDSIFMIHLGVDYDPSDVLHTVCTYFYGSYDIEGEVTRAKQGLYHEGASGFVVHFPTLRSPGMAPKGKHALTIYTICPDRLANGDWKLIKKSMLTSC